MAALQCVIIEYVAVLSCEICGTQTHFYKVEGKKYQVISQLISLAGNRTATLTPTDVHPSISNSGS